VANVAVLERRYWKTGEAPCHGAVRRPGAHLL